MAVSDVVIMGGGLAGLSLALQLKREAPELGVRVLEKSTFPVTEATHKVGESTVELASRYFTHTLGLQEHLRQSQLPKFGLRFFFGSGRIENRLEVGGSDFPPTPSYQLDRGRFENYLSTRCREQGVELLDGARVDALVVSESEHPHQITYSHDGKTSTVSAKWLVDASGRASLLKRKLDLRKPSPHKASAVWFRVDKEIKIDDWSSEPDWREGHEGAKARWFSTNHFMGKGYWVWLIPLASGSTSVGVVVDEQLHPITSLSSLDKTRQWLEEHEPQCASQIFKPGVEVQDFAALKNYSHDCRRVYSSKRWYLTGESGVFLDPFYSPGSDFIAVGNTFISSLILDDYRGKNIRSKTRFLNNLFLSLAGRTMEIFEGQYPIFGHPQVMPTKIVWDFATYWVFMAYLFFQEKLDKPAEIALVSEDITRIGEVNSHMQSLFRSAAEKIPPREIAARVDFLSISYLAELNRELSMEVQPQRFSDVTRAKVDKLERFASEICRTLGAASGAPGLCYKEIEPGEELSRFFTQVGLSVAVSK